MSMQISWVPIRALEEDQEYVVIATRFDLRSRTRMPQVFAAAQNLISGFTTTPGLIGYSLRANVLNNSLWTFSAWESDADLHRFVGGPAHSLAIKQTVEWMKSSRFVSWKTSSSGLPKSWKPVENRMRDEGRAGQAAHQARSSTNSGA